MVSVVLASRLDREHEKIGNVIPLHGEEGFLFEHLDAVKDLAIEKVYRNVQVTKGDYGPAVKDIYSMNNGLYYEIITSIPTRPTTNIPVDMTTAWGTSAKVKSHNGRSLGVFVEAGMPGRLYGPPKIRLPKDLPSRLAAIPEAFLVASNVSMDQDIAAYALIANDSDELNKYSIESGISFRYGESRGIMEGLGSVAVDRLYGRETVWLEGVDPCVPKELNIPELLRDPKSIGEIFATITSLRKILTEARRLKYIDTLDPSLEYLIPAIMTYKTLFSGRAGDFAENLPKNSHGHVVFFDSSVANGHETFARKMSHAKNVKTDLLRGGHLTLMAREMVYRSLARMVEARNEFNTHGNSTKMYDLEKIIAAQPSHLPKIRRSKKQSVA